MEARFDGGLELAGVQVDGGGVLGSGDRKNGKRMRGSAHRGFCSAHARERSRAEALSWPGHGGGEVAAGGSI